MGFCVVVVVGGAAPWRVALGRCVTSQELRSRTAAVAAAAVRRERRERRERRDVRRFRSTSVAYGERRLREDFVASLACRSRVRAGERRDVTCSDVAGFVAGGENFSRNKNAPNSAHMGIFTA